MLTHVEPFELKGQWWRVGGKALVEAFESAPHPDQVGLNDGFAYTQEDRDRWEGADADHACRGPLRFDPESGLRLSLLGSSEVAFPASDQHFAIHGTTANGTPCTLLDCFATNQEIHVPAGFADRDVLAHVLLHGIHVDSLADFTFDRAIFTIPGLREFLWAPVHDSSGKATTGLGGQATDTHTVQVNGAEITFSVGDARTRTTHTTTTERTAHIRMDLKKPIDWEEWRDQWIEPLVRLVMFATRQPTRLTSISALVDSDPPKQGAAVRIRGIDIVQQPRKLGREPNFRLERMLVSYAALDEAFDSFITNWWHVHSQLAGAADFLFGALRDPQSLEPQLITLGSVAEAYHRAFQDAPPIAEAVHKQLTARMLEVIEDQQHREFYGRRLRYANELPQKDRVIAVLRRAGTVVKALGKKPGRLAETVGNTRNYFVHLPVERPNVLEGSALYDANQLMTLAIQCNLLLDLGLSPEAALAGIERTYSGERFWRELRQRGKAWPKLSS